MALQPMDFERAPPGRWKRIRHWATPRTLLVAGLLSLLGAALFLLQSHGSQGTFQHANPSHAQLHLVIPGTSSNLNLCKTLLSAAVLGYPAPVLVNWEASGKFNVTESHLAKIHGLLRHLDTLDSARDDDLVLIVDGYDIWFQLPPEVMISRYHSATQALDERLRARFAAASSGPSNDSPDAHGLRNTVLFNGDKACWPVDANRPACWAVPESPLPRFAFGAQTDRDVERDMMHARTRWLNSGAVMGPVGDVRDVLRATLALITREYDEAFPLRNSDQMYMADLWGAQEYARLLLTGELSHGAEAEAGAAVEGHRRLPKLVEGGRHEYHIALDYASQLFQPAAGWEDYLSWVTYDGSAEVSPFTGREGADVVPPRLAGKLPNDIASARAPGGTSWGSVPLGTNEVTGQVYALLHVTGDKGNLDRWWDRQWFYPRAKALLEEAASLRQAAVAKTADGRTWWMAERTASEVPGSGTRGRGAWSDQGDDGEWLPWDQLCGQHAAALYGA